MGVLDVEVADFERALHAASAFFKGDGTGALTWKMNAHDFTLQGLEAAKNSSSASEFMVMVPRTPTWSRIQATNTRGPRPTRSRRFPWGLPWAQGAQSSRLDDENALFHLALDCMSAFLGSTSTKAVSWLAFISPEDLGPTHDHEPASPWQLDRLQDLASHHGMHRSAFCQCRFSNSDFPRPTGLLTSARPPLGTFKTGWPKIHGRYLGPLPRDCGCGKVHPSMQAKSGSFVGPRRMLEEGATTAVAAALWTHARNASLSPQGLLTKGCDLEVFKALLPKARMYEQTSDGYDTDGTIIAEPPLLSTGIVQNAALRVHARETDLT